MDTINRQELEQFVELCDIKENFNYDAEFMYNYVKDGKLVGVVAYMLQKDLGGNEYPRFIHVLIHPSIRKTKEAYKFVMNTFKDIKSKGYEVVVAVIPNWKQYMITLAEGFKFKEYHHDDEYKYYSMNIDDLIKRRKPNVYE